MPVETDMPAESNLNLNTYLNILVFFTFCLVILDKCNDSNQACRYLMGFQLGDRSPMCFRIGMMSFDLSPIRHMCQSLIRHVGLRPRMYVSNEECRGFRWVSDQTCLSSIRQACRTPKGLR